MKLGLTMVVGIMGIVLLTGQTPAQEPPQPPADAQGNQPGGAQWMRGGNMGGLADRASGLQERIIMRLIEDPDFVEGIGIAEDVLKKIKDQLFTIREEQIDLNAKLEKAGLAQAKLLLADDVDEDEVMKIVEKAGDIRTELAKSHLKTILLIKKSLTPEQLQKVKNLIKQHAEERRRDMGDRSKDRKRRAQEWRKAHGKQEGEKDGDKEGDKPEEAPKPPAEEQSEQKPE